MCLNCGCGVPDDNHGDEKNITNKSLKEAGDANGQSLEETKHNMREALKPATGENPAM